MDLKENFHKFEKKILLKNKNKVHKSKKMNEIKKKKENREKPNPK